MSHFRPDPLLLSRTERAEGRLWHRKAAYALFGWVLTLFPTRIRPADDLDDVLALLKALVVFALVIAILRIILPGEVGP